MSRANEHVWLRFKSAPLQSPSTRTLRSLRPRDSDRHALRIRPGTVAVTRDVIILPAAATLVGFIAAVGIGSRRGGLIVTWLAHFAAYSGFHADWAFLGLSSHLLTGKLAFLFDAVGLVVLAVATLIIGTVGFTIG